MEVLKVNTFLFISTIAVLKVSDRRCLGPTVPLAFKGGCHARVQRHEKGVVFQGEARAAQAVFRVSKTVKSRKRVWIFRLINTGLGYDFEPISIIRV